MFSVGEILLIAFVLLVVFSASRMGTLGNALGKFVYSFKKASRGNDLVDVTPPRKLQRTDEEPRKRQG